MLTGGRTPDDFPGERIEDPLLLVSGTYVPTIMGEVSYVSGSGFQFMQDDGIVLLRSGAINAVDHEKLRQLVHLAEEGGPFEGFANAVRDIGPAGSAFPTGSVWWTDASRRQKIVERIIVRNPNRTPATVQWRTYVSGSNSIAASFTDTIVYSGVFEVSRTRTTP